MKFTTSSSTASQDQQDPISNKDSGYSSHLDAEVPSLPSFPSAASSLLTSASLSSSTIAPDATFDIKSTIASLRGRFMCSHPLAAKARKRHEQSRDHPDRVHPADKHVLPQDPEQLPLQKKVKLYLTRYHMSDIRRAMADSIASQAQESATISRYVIRLQIDPTELLQCCSSLGNDFLSDLDSVAPDFHLVCCQILQQMLGEDKALLSEQVRLSMRIKFLPSVFQECHLTSIAAALEQTREDIAGDSNSYSGLFILTGRVSCISLAEHVIYSQTYKCDNPRCNNRNCLHFTPSATQRRVIKRTEDDGFMETGTSASLLKIDLICSHCGLEMPESILDRDYMKQQTVVLDCLNASQAEGCFLNQVAAVLRDDLANTVVLGEEVRLVGKLSRVFSEKNHEIYFHGVKIEVNNILRDSCREPLRIADPIAAIIHRNMSAWNTGQAIVDLLDGIVPRDIYRKLKLALLLSAVSVAERDVECGTRTTRKAQIRPSIHVLVLKNNHDTLVPALISSVASCRKNVIWDHADNTARNPLYRVCPPNKSSSGEIQAHLLSAAKDGIVLFEMDQLDKKSRGHIAPNGSDIFIHREDSTQALDMVCCCWSTYTCLKTASLKSNHDGLAADEGASDLVREVPMIDAFDIVVLQDEMDGVSEVSQAIATHTIRRHMMDSAEYPSQRRVTLADLSQFIRLASKIDVRLSLECEQLLRSYFEVMRSKGSGLEMKELSSISVMSTLLRLATCHAKLCFRPIATTDDALVSIMMVEETVAARFGVSRLGFVPLMDGKENITRLYSQPAFPEFIVDHDFSRVPMTDTNEYGLDLDVDTNVPISVQEGRDLMMERMYTHLARVISENAA
ncbi:hypothetical protein EDD21DRAFT_444259 [Dissophora ornata]|nr:hypothetical protein EDD21DRAFT_444259 [Dissophora ornata]